MKALYAKSNKSIKQLPYSNVRVDKKFAELEKLRKFGPPKYDYKKIEEMVNKNFERKMKDGRLQGTNLTYQKVELQNDIAYLN